MFSKDINLQSVEKALAPLKKTQYNLKDLKLAADNRIKDVDAQIKALQVKQADAVMASNSAQAILMNLDELTGGLLGE